MPAKSKQQQKFMGIVKTIQQGDEPASKFSKAAQDAAEDMKEKDVDDFASTKHKGLPKKVEQYLRQKIRKSVEEMIKEDWFDRLSSDDQKKYVKSHPGSKKAKQAAHDKEREKRARKIRSKNYTVDGDGNIVKVKKTKEDPKKQAKHMAALKKGYMPGDDNYEKFVKEDYVETCGYTQSVDGKKLKTPGATGEEDRHLKEAFTGGDRKILFVIARELADNLKKVGLKGKQLERVMSSAILSMRYDKSNLNYKKFKRFFPRGYNSKLVKRLLDKFHDQYDAVRWTFIRQAIGNRGVKVGDIVRFRDEHRRPVSQRVKVKWIMKSKPNKEFVDFNYITNKGTFHDQHLQGTKAWKLYYSKERRESVEEERDYKTEYKKYGSSTKAKKYRAELNQYNRKNGTYGNGDGKDASHKGGKIVGFEKESTNRGRAEKSRLKKESVNERIMLKYNGRPITTIHYNGPVSDMITTSTRSWMVFDDEKDVKKTFKSHLDDIKKDKDYTKEDLETFKKMLKKIKMTKTESVNEARLDPKQLLQQLGGNKFITMVGAKNLAVDKSKNELHMKIMRNAKGVSHVRIKLTSRDLYDMEFIQVRAGKITIKSRVKGVYADQLGKMFKKNTGLNVRL